MSVFRFLSFDCGIIIQFEWSGMHDGRHIASKVLHMNPLHCYLNENCNEAKQLMNISIGRVE